MLPGWMASISSNTAKLLLISLSWLTRHTHWREYIKQINLNSAHMWELCEHSLLFYRLIRHFHNSVFTLKLEILVDFPASANVLFTHFTMMSSFTFCPSPSSSSTFNVYLKEWRVNMGFRCCFLTLYTQVLKSFTSSWAATPAPESK